MDKAARIHRSVSLIAGWILLIIFSVMPICFAAKFRPKEESRTDVDQTVSSSKNWRANFSHSKPPKFQLY